MKNLFKYLLKKYSKTEKERLEIYKVLHEETINSYPEQTMYGNVYNSFIEFVMGNSFINFVCGVNNEIDLQVLKRGINESFDEGIKYIKNEKLKK